VAGCNRTQKHVGAGPDHPGLGRAAERGRGRPATSRSAARLSGTVSGALPGPASPACCARRAASRARRSRRGHGPTHGGADLRRAARRGDPVDRRTMANATCVSLRSVQRMWQVHRLQPHRIRTFKRSHDPAFAAKLEDIVGPYMDPPKHATVLSLDEKVADPGA
jgi:hypothetical protein